MKSGWVLRPGAAEFPHENALINRGALWIGTALCGAETVATATAPSGEPHAPPPRTKPKTTVSRSAAVPTPALPAVVTSTEPAPEARPLAASRTGHDATDAGNSAAQHGRVEDFVRTIAEVALAHGAEETAAHVESLFKFGTPAPLELSDLARTALCDGNILEATEGGIHATAWFMRTSSAWQKMLRGEAENLAVCGESTLDGWTADLIACLVAKPAMASAIRRDLRRRGIAAFGMLDS